MNSGSIRCLCMSVSPSIPTTGLSALLLFQLIRGEPERAPNTRGTGSGFICIYKKNHYWSSKHSLDKCSGQDHDYASVVRVLGFDARLHLVN